MENEYSIIITNGQGTANVMNGNYTVESNTTGYDNTSIDPKTLNIVEGTDTYELKIAASGTLTLHVTETGEASGKAVIGAKFIRCDSEGNTYGTEITSDTSGNAVFQYVPFDSTNAPLIYYKQTQSDGSHIFDDTLKNTSLDLSTKTVEVTNALPPTRTFKLIDTNYNNLPISSGNITLK